MSTSLFHFIRAATAPDGKALLMEGAVQPPTPHSMLPAGFPAGSSNTSRACPTPVLAGSEVQSLVSAVQRKLHDGFHWTELYLGALLALLGVLGAALLYWEYQNHKRKKDLARTADNLRFNADANFLKRLIGGDDAPTWLKNPDYERMGWVNDVIVHLWPHVAAAASVMVRELAEPLLKQGKPKWMSNISLHTFTLGDVPPRVHGVKVFRREMLGEELLIDMDITWTGSQKFQLQINPLPNLPVPLGIGALVSRWLGFRVGVADINLRGRVRAACRPLLNKMPVLGAVKVSLLEQPQISYSLIVQGGDISFLPGLEVFINNVLREQVLRPYILPEGFAVPLVPGGGRETPAGILYLRVIEARNIPNMDIFTKTDAYAVVFVRGRRKRRTHIEYNTLNPKWDEDFELLVHDPEHQSVNIVIMNRSTFGPDEEIGRVSIPIKDLPAGETEDRWLELGKAKSHEPDNPLGASVRGVRTVGRTVGRAVSLSWLQRHKEPPKLHLQATYYKVGTDVVKAAHAGATSGEVQQAAEGGAGSSAGGAQVSAEVSSRIANMLRGGILYVKIKKGMDAMATGDEDGTPARATQVVINCAGEEKRTAEADGRENQDWEETLEFAVGGDYVDREGELIEVEVWDYHWVNAPSALTWINSPGSIPWAQALQMQGKLPTEGWVDIPLREVVERKRLTNTWSLNDIPEGRIEMELQWLPVLEEST